MSKRNKIIALVAYTAVAVALGRYSVPTSVERKTETETKTQVDQKTSEKKNKQVHKNTVSTTKTVKRPDGTVEITKVIENKDRINSDSDSNTDTSVNQNTKTSSSEKISRGKGVQIGLMGGVNLGVKDLTYGVYVNYPVLGPINLGAFGFNNSTLGLSIGLQF